MERQTERVQCVMRPFSGRAAYKQLLIYVAISFLEKQAVALQLIDEGGQRPGAPEMLGAPTVCKYFFLFAHCTHNFHMQVLQ